MKNEKISLVRVWMERSSADLKSAKSTLDSGVFADTVYHSEQAVQKAIKAVLTLFDEETTEHRVASLFNEKVVLRYPELDKLVNIAFNLEKHWLKTRYPLKTSRGVFNPLRYYKKEFAKKSLEEAGFFVDTIKRFIKDTFDIEL